MYYQCKNRGFVLCQNQIKCLKLYFYIIISIVTFQERPIPICFVNYSQQHEVAGVASVTLAALILCALIFVSRTRCSTNLCFMLQYILRVTLVANLCFGLGFPFSPYWRVVPQVSPNRLVVRWRPFRPIREPSIYLASYASEQYISALFTYHMISG